MRDLNEGDEVASMTLEHYPGMTEKALTAIVKEAKKRWDIMDATVIHRVGEPVRDRPDRFCRSFRRASRGSL